MRPSFTAPRRGLGNSLSARFVTFVILGEIAFGVVLGVTVGLYSVRAAAQQRSDSLKQVSGAVAAALMPMIADQDAERVHAQLEGIVRMAESGDITCMRIVDGSGEVIASTDADADCCTNEPTPGILAIFTKPKLVAQPVVVDGLEVARVYVQFAPMGVWEALASPTLAGSLVVLGVALVSAPWTAWLVVRHVIEPLTAIKDGASDLAKGRREIVLDDGRRDEIGDLARALDDLSRQLKEKEERLLASYRDVSDAYEAEAEARGEVERLMKTKSDFVAVASHEIRSPLAVIGMYTEMLEDGEYGPLDERPRAALSAIASAAARLGSIISDLMDAALLERGLMLLEFVETRLDEIVRDAVEAAGVLAEYRSGVSVRLENDTGELWVWGDAVRLRQVLDNLLSNAVKYSDGAKTVSVRMRVDDTQVHVDVVDRGRGIPKQKCGLLFSLFGRLDAADNRDTAGLGLGLAISARIAQAHDGRISYRDNEEGKGAVFTMSLPLELDAEEREATAVVELTEERRTADG